MYRSFSLITLLGGLLTAGVALASPTEVNLSLKSQPAESYEQFVRRAETLAQNTVRQSFQENRSLGELRVLVVGENQGAIAPVLTVQVDRDNWNRDPSIKRWQNVFPSSKALLGFEPPQTQSDKPTAPPTTVPIPTPEATAPPQNPTPPELIPLPYADGDPFTQPQIPLPDRRLRSSRTP